MLTYGDTSFAWNGRQLSSVSNEETVISYEYNTDGQRTKKICSSTDGEVWYTFEYFYCGDILAGEKFMPNSEYIDEDAFTVTYMFDENGEYFGFIHNGTPYYYVKNAQNDVYLIINADGVAEVLYQYDAWGNITNCVDASDKNLSAANPITYRSYHYEFETGYYFLSTRYYSPEFHRFINADGVLGVNQDMNEYNLFAYCSNDPVNNFDFNGYGKISNWFKAVGQKISNWWNSIPPASSMTIPSTNQVVGLTSDLVLGTAEEITGNYSTVNYSKNSASSTTKLLDEEKAKSYSRASKTAKVGNAVITGTRLALDLGNTWTENNSNTNGDRVLKSVVQVTGVAAGVLVGVAVSASFVGVGAVASTALTIAGCIVIDRVSDWYYSKVGIE